MKGEKMDKFLNELNTIAREEMRASEVVDITTHVGIQREMREDAEMKLPPHDRIKQVAWLLKRMTWIQLEGIATDITARYSGSPDKELTRAMSHALIAWAQEIDK